MKEKFFARKSRIICLVWSVAGIILLGFIFAASSLNDSSLQKIIGNIVMCYAVLSCILAGAVASIKKKEKKCSDKISGKNE